MKRILFISLTISMLTVAAFSQNTGRITGTVLLSTADTRLHQVSVQIVELKQNTVTDDRGNFEFANIPAGRYTLITHQQGFTEGKQTVEVTAGGTTNVEFRLALGGLKEEVTVSGSGTETSVFESIASVTTMDSSQLTSRAAVGLGDVLDSEAGVSKRSSSPGASRPVIRGFDGDRVKVAADGVGIGSLGSQSGDHSEPIDTLALERIEVVKGPATLLYGSNAIGGVVNAISGHDEGAHPGVRGYFSAIGGVNNGQAAVNAGVDYGRKNWMFWANGGTQRTGDYKAGGDFGRVLNTFTRNTTGGIGFGYFGKKAFFNTGYTYYTNRYGVPLDFREADPEERSLRVWRGDLKFNVGYNDPELAITGVKLTVDLNNYRHQELEDGDVGTTFRNKVNSVRGMFEQKKAGVLTGRFGFEGYKRTFSTLGAETLVVDPVKQNSFAVFALEELKFERVTFQFGGRVERNSYDPVNTALADRSFTGFSGAAGVKFDLWTGGLFVANYSHGFRAPALEELYNNGPHGGSLLFEVGNSNLRGEVNNGIDLSLRHRNERFKAEANFFYYAFKNFIFLAPTGTFDPDSEFEIAEFLQADSRFTGTELSLDVTANKHLNVIAGVDYVNAELRTGQPLPRIAPLRGRFGLDVHHGNFSVKPEFVAVGRQDRVFQNESPTAGYGLFNVLASYVVPTKHAAHVFSVNAYNLGNKLYFNHVSFIKEISPEIGRGVRFSYTVRFF
jgi:iron complex outermembrane receptor protein